jgi:HPt (histidine-containing phosphotransfer) domain-containing protein
VAFLAHRLKGAAANLSAGDLARVARELEDAASGESRGDPTELLARLERAADAFTAAAGALPAL